MPEDKASLLYLGGHAADPRASRKRSGARRLPDCVLVMMGSGEDDYVEHLRASPRAREWPSGSIIRPPVRPHEVVAVAAQARTSASS